MFLVLVGENLREKVELEPRAATVVLKDISRIFK